MTYIYILVLSKRKKQSNAIMRNALIAFFQVNRQVSDTETIRDKITRDQASTRHLQDDTVLTNRIKSFDIIKLTIHWL